MWVYYKDKGISTKQIENRILSLGFVSNSGRGWYKMIPKGAISKSQAKRRIHIIPSADKNEEYLEIHIDTPQHHVKGGKKAKRLLEDLEKELVSPNNLSTVTIQR